MTQTSQPSLFQRLFPPFAKIAFKLRYRIEVKELNSSEKLNKERGILFLPNHPAYIDNLFLFNYLWPKFRITPLANDKFRYAKILGTLLKWANALLVPDLRHAMNAYKVRKSQDVLEEITEGLKRGENFMLSPAGQTKNTEREFLGAVSGAHGIIGKVPDVNIALIRVTGLWGSSFSRAITGTSPDVPKVLWHNIKALLKNGIFFMPRRKVQIEIEFNPTDFPRSTSRLQFNRYLENWYNRFPDPLNLVSYSIWRSKTLTPKEIESKKSGAKERPTIPLETEAKVYREIRKIIQKEDAELRPEMSLAMDLGLDSVNIAELSVYLYRHFSAEPFNFDALQTVQDVLDIAAGTNVGVKPLSEIDSTPWPNESNRPAPLPTDKKTVPEAFFYTCQKMGNRAACRDDSAGIMSYKKMKRAVTVLALHFQTFPDERIAILLPASVGTTIVYLALLAAGKTPVMLNWTLGPRYVEEMVKSSGINSILSSWRFLDKAANMDLGKATDKLLLLEKIRYELPLKTKLKGALLSLMSPKRILKALPAKKIDPLNPAVILFTSGSEAMPKMVPLSHQNILYSVNGFFRAVNGFPSDEKLLAILPPFHVFGFVCGLVFPLTLGTRVAFYPNPTDTRALVDRIDKWSITLFPSAPTFLKAVFKIGAKEQLKNLRLIFSGAEKAPIELQKQIESLGTEFLEGYGATECSSIISVNQPGKSKKGVGPPCPGIETCTIHPERLTLLPPGTEGEICICSPGVFSGYLNSPLSPFITLNGKRWYRTGDLGYLDPDGYLILSGRLKRFIKIAGEMISLTAIEEAINETLKELNLIPPPGISSIAVCPLEGDTHLIAFTNTQLDKDFANEILRKKGFSNLIKISSVKQIDAIPILGSGKVNYGELHRMAKLASTPTT